MAGKRRQHDANDTLATIPWKWRDWRASKARAVMTPEARGVYRELLDACWGEAGCSLPNDDATLAGLAGVSMDYWILVRSQVLAWFDEADGRLTNPRALYEWKKARGFRSEKRRAGKEGAKARWEKEKAAKALLQQTHGTAIDLPMAKHGSPSPSSVIRQPSSVGTEEPPAYVPPLAVATENAIRAKTVGLESKLLRAVGLLSERTHRDALELMREVTAYKRPDGTLVSGRSNPSGMSSERLERSIADAEAWFADLEKKGATA